MSCELAAGDFPPLGELAHKEGYCFCYLCTCGSHICPSNPPQFLSKPKLNYTSYQSDFSKKQIDSPKPYVRTGQLNHSKNPMKFRTTLQDYYPSYASQMPVTRSTKEDRSIRRSNRWGSRWGFPY